MTPDRWKKIEELYHSAREKEESQRVAFLNEACAGDEALRREIESLLAEEKREAGFLESPALEIAAKEMSQDQTRSLLGQRVGSYQVLSLLGAGGMGEVYRAQDTKLNRPVAVKFLRQNLADPAARRRFQREAQMASSLNHPHIVTVHDVGELEGQQYLVTEFIDAGTLKDWAAKQKRTWQEIVELLVGVADGIAAAHVAGITHRDIKPANILISKSGYAK